MTVLFEEVMEKKVVEIRESDDDSDDNGEEE